MESISKILNAIAADGQEAADKIIAGAEKNADELHKLYKKEADTAEKEIMRKAEKNVKEIHHRGISQAGIESRNIKLSVRRRALEEAFARAEEKLASMSDNEKKDIYEKFIEKYSSGEKVTVQLNEEDRKAFGKKLRAGKIDITIEENAGSFKGGLIIKENDTEINCTFEVIIASAKKEMEAEIASMLFS